MVSASRPRKLAPVAVADEPAVEVHALGRDYGERVALSDVTLTVRAGATLAVFGPNGAGKSTLLRVLASLLRPHRGSVRVLGRALPGEGWAVRGRVGLLGHEPLLYRDLSGRENLRYQARLFGVDAERVEQLLERTGMTRRADEPLRTLSRGMVQRLAVCRAVLHEPRAAAARRTAGQPRPGRRGIARAADRAGRRPHPRADEPRPGGGTRAGGPRARPARRPRDRHRGGGGRYRGRAESAVPVSRTVSAIVRKDLLLELRTKETVPAMALFAVTTFVVFHFGLNRGSVAGDLAAGVLWVTLLFAAMLGINRLFVAEREQGGFDAFLLAPADRTALLFAKAAALFAFLSVLELIAVPAFALLLLEPSPWPALPGLIGVLALANVGIAVIGTLASALAIQTRARDLIAPLLALPLLIPVVIAAARATTPLLLAGGPAGVPARWPLILGLYDVVFALTAYAVFDFLLED